MEPAVRQFDSISPPVSVSWPKKAGVIFVISCSMFILRWAWDGFFHWPHESLVHSVCTSVMFGAIYAFLQFSYRLPQRLIIGHDFIEARTQTGSLKFKKRIGREEIKSISENRRGIYVRDRGKFAARILGLIFIPASIPAYEYKEIKAILDGWKPVQTLP